MTTHEWWVLWAVGALAVVVFAAAGLTWWLHWQCVDGFWHWRKECDGHDVSAEAREGLAPSKGSLVLARFLHRAADDDPDMWDELPVQYDEQRSVGLPDVQELPGGSEAALDEAWPATLHAINTDLHQPGSIPHMFIGGEAWADRVMAEQWDWRMGRARDLDDTTKRHEDEQWDWRMRMVGERKAHRLDCGLEWRDDMGLAA